MKHRIKKIRRKITYSTLYFLAILVEKIAVFLPESLVFFVCETISFSYYILVKKERKKVVLHLTQAFSDEYSEKEIKELAKKVFINLGRNIAELFLMKTFDKAKLTERLSCEGHEIIDENLKKGKGILVLGGHVGNWELASPYFCHFSVGGGAVVKKLKDKAFEKLVNRMRTHEKCKVIDRSNPKEILKMLKDNKLIGLLADQDIKNVDGVFVDFFGRPAYTPVGPVKIARASGCALVPGFLVRDPQNKYRHKIIIHPAIEIDRKNKDPQMLIEKTQEWTTLLEKHIRKYPDQWVWMHKRWKTTPEKLKSRREK